VYLSTYPHAAEENGGAAAPVYDPQHGWLELNGNITTFFASLPDERRCVVRGEDLLRAPDAPLRRIAEWLGLRTDDEAIEEMKHPERSPFAGFGPRGARYGNDLLFLENPVLRVAPAAPQSLEGPLSWREDGAGFVPSVKLLAREFGYE
jgi:hypothetical protein